MEKSENKLISAIIVAAGNASRLQCGNLKSKGFLLLNGKPLLMYSLEKLALLKSLTEIVIVTNDIANTNELLCKNDLGLLKKINMKVVMGGMSRKDSVYHGFCNINSSTDLVLIHDVARPLFDLSTVEKCIREADLSGAAVMAAPVIDTIKKAKSDKDKLLVETTLNRNELYLVQTPQVFRYNLLFEAYKMFNKTANLNSNITDEATMLEHLGKAVSLVLSSGNNMKITYPEDLEIVSAVLKKKVKVQKERVVS